MAQSDQDNGLPRRTFLRLMTLALSAVLLARRTLGATASPPPAKTSMKSIALLDAPSNLGLRPLRENHEPGAWRLPSALRAHGLRERLQGRDGGAVPRPPYSPERDDATGFLNGPELAKFSRALAEKISPLLDQKLFPLVLGGDCSILLGSALALRRRGRYGLCFIDGHSDFAYVHDPARRGRYTAAGLDLALSTGHGPAALCDLDKLQPYLHEEDVAAIGMPHVPIDNPYYDIASFYHSKIKIIEREEIAAKGAENCARQALERVIRPELAGFWIHLDADVLNASIMPAVDSPNEAGITFAELTGLLRVLLASPHAVGMEVTILDPELDPAGTYAGAFVDALVAGFRGLAAAQ